MRELAHEGRGDVGVDLAIEKQRTVRFGQLRRHLREIIERFFRERPINALSVTAADFRASLDGALVAARAQRP